MVKKLLLGNKKSKSGKKEKVIKKVPKTVQDTIPYTRVYEGGIIETDPGVFTKSYLLEDINFKLLSYDEQENKFEKYSDLLNSFGHEVDVQITIFNRNIDKEKFKKNVLLKIRPDAYNDYRQEYNDMLLDKIENGTNHLIHEKYLTIAMKADNIEKAIGMFNRIEPTIIENIKSINECDTEPLTTIERLSVLYEINHIGSDTKLYEKKIIDGKEVESFNLEWTKKMGITTKDLIAPSSYEFKPSYFKIDDKFARTVFLDNIPTYLTSDILSDIADAPYNMLTSVFHKSIKREEATKMVRNHLTNINSNVIDAQKKASRSGYSPELVSFELQQTQNETNKLLGDITSRNQKLFYTTILITHFADSLEELDEATSSLASIAGKHLCQIKKLTAQQEYGFVSSLPLCLNKTHVKRLLTTEAASIFIPFSTQELNQPNGMYYGQHAVSKDMILLNRINLRNGNGVILGTPGSGKSFAAKREMTNVLLGTDDDVYIIDPEREYAPLAEIFGGEVIRIAPGSGIHINPLDMDINYADENTNPIALKSDNIYNICEVALGPGYSMSPTHKSVIDRCVIQVYQNYLEHMTKLKEQGSDLTIDINATPTLKDLYALLLSQQEPEAQNIALALERFITGSLDTFAHRTNVNTNNRFIIYDIKDIGAGLNEIGLQICLNDIWNKTISNKAKGKRTWFYIDEFYLLTQTESSAKFLQVIFKRARKWGGIPTGITQNVEDMLATKESRTIISNSDFVMMLNQAPIDRAELASMLNISDSLISYVTNANHGQGLIYTGKTIIPFIDKFPTDTKLYKAMTTKLGE